tara:strand:- start:636 stop:2498 length:1863 start_codon:yes stop_codon:yes gene_type:complete
MGANKSFVIYKIFGIMRSEFFLFCIDLFLASFFLNVILNFLIRCDLSNSSLKVVHELHLRFGFLLLFLFSSSTFIIDGLQNKFNCFRDTAYSSYPVLINNIYDGILENDFFTNAIQNTPKIFTAWFLKIPYILGMEWYNGIYLLHVFINIIYLPLLFICISRILNQFLFQENSNFLKTLFVQLLAFILVWSRIIEFFQAEKSPMGWPNAFYTPYFNAEPDELALMFGLYFLYLVLGNFKYKNLFCPLLLGLCIFFHALYGLAIFFLAMVYYTSSRNKYFDSTISFNFIFGLFFPSLLLFLKYGHQKYLHPEKFIEIYTLTTHSFHYKISEVIGWPAVFWFSSYLLLLILSLRMKDKSLTQLSFLSLLYFIIPPLIQFLGTEVLKIKIIATLGLNRFSVFNSFIFFVNCLVMFKKSKYFIYCIFFIKKVKTYFHEEVNNGKIFKVNISKNYKQFFLLFFQKITAQIITIIIIMFSIWNLTKHNPLENYFLSWKSSEKSASLESFCTFIKENTHKNSIVFVNGKDRFLSMQLSFAIRCFGQRATFSDFSFPFNESVLLEWQTRNYYCENFEFLSLDDFFELSDKYSLTHLLTTRDQVGAFNNFPSLWKNKDLILYDIANINK